jgi:colanic acid biosynthesis glycosyl transferase WcaI
MDIMRTDRPHKKKILVVCQHFWPESFRINDICDFFVEKDCEVEVLCGIPNYPSGKFFSGYSYFRNRRQVHNGVKVRRAFEIPRGSNTNFRIFINYISFPLASLFHIPRLLTRKYDKIFVFTYSPIIMAVAGIIVGKIKKTEVTLYVLDLWPENLFSVLKIRSRFLRAVVRKISHWHYRQADKLLVLTESMKTRVAGITNLPDSKILILPQACEKVYEKDVHDKQLARKFKSGFNILFTGNISPAQSFETIIAAAKQLKRDDIKDINWIIVGDGMSRAWLESKVKKAGLSENFYFEGLKPVEDIPKYTAVADLLIGCLVKSDLLEATIPSKVTSYIAAGRPIVLSMDGEVRELINNVIRSGYAGPTEDSKALAENIRKIHAMSQKERQKMGARGRAYHFKYLERNIILNKLYDFMFDIRRTSGKHKINGAIVRKKLRTS